MVIVNSRKKSPGLCRLRGRIS